MNKCGASSTTLSVTGSNISWYDSPTGGNLLGSGNSFTTPVISSNTSYYAQLGGCDNRTEITVNIFSSVPSAPTNVTDPAFLSGCEGATTTLQASGTGIIRWYDAISGGNLIATGNSFVTAPLPDLSPTPPTTVIYFAEDNNGCGGSPRTAITVTVDNSVVTTITNTTSFENQNICAGTPVSLSVSSNTGTIFWWSGVGGSPFDSLGTSSAYITGIQANTTYQVRAVSGVCVSDPIFIMIRVSHPTQNLPGVSTNNLACPGGTANITASSSFGTPYWYDAPTGGNLLGVGSPFTTPVINAPTSFYVQTGLGSCASGRREALVGLQPAPNSPITINNDTIRATNLFSSYVLKRDGDTVASSNSSGSFAFPVDACGDYQATFTNTVNNCPNTTASYFRSYNSTEFACEARVTLNNVAFPITYSVEFAPFYSEPTAVATANPIIFNLTTSASSCGSASGSRYISVKTATGCVYNFAIGASLSSQNNISLTSETDLVTPCSFNSNIITVNSLTQNAPVNTTPANQLSICTGNTTTLSASASGILSWYDVPTGGTAIATGNTFTTPVLNANKTYYAENESGTCVSQRTAIEVIVNSIPTANISPATVTICDGENVTLTAGGGGTYTWSNSGGSNETATFSPTTNTTYSVTVTENNCSATATVAVTVNAIPTASISPASVSICSGESETLTASGGISYEWSNNEATADITVTPAQTTTYTVTITNADNCTATATSTVTVNTVNASINGPTTICSGLDATLTASGGNNYEWSNNETTASITVAPTQATTYSVIVTGAGGCTATASQTIDVQNAPTATISGNTTICTGESTTLTANGGNTYEWNNTETTASITVNPITNTTYTVTVSIGANCTASESVTVIVNSPTSFGITETICFGDTYELNGTVYDATDIYTQTLTNDAGCDSIITLNLTVLSEIQTTLNEQICVGQTFEFDGQQLDETDIYTAVFTAASGCDSTVTLNLNVVTEILASIDATICEGDSYEFDGQQLTLEDVYTATFVSTGGCNSVVTLTLTVNALPQPTVTANNADLSTEQFDSYQWLLNGNDIQNADQQNYTATQNGDYSVKVTDANGCENTSDAVNVTVVSVANYELGLDIYPNPTNGMLNIETQKDGSEISVISMEGKVLINTILKAKQTVLDITTLAHGMYIIEVKTENNISRTRIVKE